MTEVRRDGYHPTVTAGRRDCSPVAPVNGWHRGWFYRGAIALAVGLAACTFSPDGASSPDLDGSASDGGDLLDGGAIDGGPNACGNGAIEAGEACDDQNTDDGDGCSATCAVEPGYQCFFAPSRCEQIPSLSAAGVTVVEGNTAGVTVSLDSSSEADVRFRYATVDGSAVAPNDYVATTGQGLIAAGETSTVVEVTTVADLDFEPQERFEVVIDEAVGATVAVDRAEVTVVEAGVPLIDRGLVVRYFLDEARTNPSPALVVDAGPLSFDLDVSVEDGDPSFVLVNGHGAASWTSEGEDGLMSEALLFSDTFRSLFEGGTAATLEAVASIAAAGNASRLIHIGNGSERGFLTLAVTEDGLFFFYDGVEASEWPPPPGGLDRRAVITLVVDTTQEEESERLRLYFDGVRLAGPDQAPPLNFTLDIPFGRSLTLGNRSAGEASFQGELFYAAIYNVALTDAEVLDNVQALLSSDDGP